MYRIKNGDKEKRKMESARNELKRVVGHDLTQTLYLANKTQQELVILRLGEHFNQNSSELEKKTFESLEACLSSKLRNAFAQVV